MWYVPHIPFALVPLVCVANLLFSLLSFIIYWLHMSVLLSSFSLNPIQFHFFFYCYLARPIISVALVSAWAQAASGSSVEVGYLGKPDWNSNILAWHIVLMVAGFFFTQVLAMVSWSVFPTPPSAKTSHVLLQSVALITMALGLYAVKKYKDQSTENSLTTMHALLGTGAIVVFSANYGFGCFMGIRKAFCAACAIPSGLDLVLNHRSIGSFAFGLTVLAIVTGIMDQTGRTGCAYVDTVSSDTANPAAYYSKTPNGCKIANALGAFVTITAGVTVLLMSLRLRRVSGFKNLLNTVSRQNQNVQTVTVDPVQADRR
jgi:Eukaryotic cytochrome b561